MTSLFEKLATQAKGLMHDTADKMEDPGRTARQLTRDLDNDLAAAEQALIQVRAEYNMELGKRDAAQQDVDKYTGYAQKAVAKGDDNLAREALQAKKQAQDTLTQLQAQIDKFKPSVDQLEHQIADLRQRKADMDRRTGLIEARSSIAEAQDRAATVLNGIGGSGASARFDALEDKVSHQEAVAQAKMSVSDDHSGKSLDDKFKALDNPTSDIDDELAALKAAAGKN